MKINHDIINKNSLINNIKNLINQRMKIKYIYTRFTWYVFPRFFILKKYPLHIDIESSSFCQLKCPMCFRFHKKIENEGNMSFDLFKKIIDEIEGKVYSIKFTGRGEPLINKQFPKFIEYLKGKKIGEIAIITNGGLLDKNLMNLLIDCGIDRIAFSIDGLQDEYEKIRKPMKYDEIYNTVKMLYDLKKKRNKKKPIIRIQGVKTTIEKDREFIKIWKPVSDDILFLIYKDYSVNHYNDLQSTYPCPLLYQRLMIHWNGIIPMCINDEYEDGVLGNINNSSIKEIWSNNNIQIVRDIHKKGLRHFEYKNCSRCALHREGHGKK